MKPDWKYAPEWAKWLAMDRSGEWYWYDEVPEIAGASWIPFRNISFAGQGEGWRGSLEGRPVE
jgi:hypothetical protein